MAAWVVSEDSNLSLLARLNGDALIYVDDLKIFSNIVDVSDHRGLLMNVDIVMNWLTGNSLNINI